MVGSVYHCLGRQVTNVFVVSLVLSGFLFVCGDALAQTRQIKPLPTDDSPPGNIAMTCLAAAGQAAAGNSNARQVAIAAAERLKQRVSLNSQGRPAGWIYGAASAKGCTGKGELDAFGDGTCNSAQTNYSFQTGLAANCLARVALLTGDLSLSKLAEDVLTVWSSIGARAGEKGFYFWYSDNANDAGRYVRNTNLLMGSAAAWAFLNTKSPRMKDLALSVANAESKEIANGNFGYFGENDPRFKANPKDESLRIENHAPYVAKGLLDIGVIFEDTKLVGLARLILDSWLTCGGKDCSKRTCESWAGRIEGCKVSQISAPCFFDDTANAKQKCQIAKRAIGAKPTAFQLWSFFDRHMYPAQRP